MSWDRGGAGGCLGWEMEWRSGVGELWGVMGDDKGGRVVCVCVTLGC